MQDTFEIFEFSDTTIETSAMSVNRNAFMKWADDNDYRKYDKIIHLPFGETDEVTRIYEWNEYLSHSNRQLPIDLQQYIAETFTRNQSQLQLNNK